MAQEDLICQLQVQAHNLQSAQEQAREQPLPLAMVQTAVPPPPPNPAGSRETHFEPSLSQEAPGLLPCLGAPSSAQ